MGLLEQQEKKAGQELLGLRVWLVQQDYLVLQVSLAETAPRVNLEYLATQDYQASKARIFIHSLKISLSQNAYDFPSLIFAEKRDIFIEQTM